LIAAAPKSVALKLERELFPSAVPLKSGRKKWRGSSRTHPKKDPMGVLTAETIYTGGEDMISVAGENFLL
jgi:hypothetical protein